MVWRTVISPRDTQDEENNVEDRGEADNSVKDRLQLLAVAKVVFESSGYMEKEIEGVILECQRVLGLERTESLKPTSTLDHFRRR